MYTTTSVRRAGADVNTVNLQGRSPLRIVLLEGNLDTAGLLLDNGANIDYLDNDSRSATFLHRSSCFSTFFNFNVFLY
jgi:ankyrin repeat protein